MTAGKAVETLQPYKLGSHKVCQKGHQLHFPKLAQGHAELTSQEEISHSEQIYSHQFSGNDSSST